MDFDTEIEKRISALCQLTNNKEKGKALLKYIKDNRNNIQEERKNKSERYKHAKTVNKKKMARRSYGIHENQICKYLIDICKWKTNKKYMELASNIMIACGYTSYKICSNRLKQKIENKRKCLIKEKSKITDLEKCKYICLFINKNYVM